MYIRQLHMGYVPNGTLFNTTLMRSSEWLCVVRAMTPQQPLWTGPFTYWDPTLRSRPRSRRSSKWCSVNILLFIHIPVLSFSHVTIVLWNPIHMSLFFPPRFLQPFRHRRWPEEVTLPWMRHQGDPSPLPRRAHVRAHRKRRLSHQ